MSFSAEWLALREPVDHASRSTRIAADVARHFASWTRVSVLDLGCGTGSNLRATASLLPAEQHWTLVDYDADLLTTARRRLAEWAETEADESGPLRFERQGKRIAVTFRQADLAAGVAGLLRPAPDLVTASALFDLISVGWIERFAQDVASVGAAFYTVLTYDGRDVFTPAHPADADVTAAFAAHQGGDKGFGPAAGPKAPAALASAFRAAGYRVSEGDSPWRIEATHAALARELLPGIARAVEEAGLLRDEVQAWLAFRLRAIDSEGAILTGHTDTFAQT